MTKSIKSQFKVKRVKRCLKFAGVPSKGDMYITYKVSGPRGLVKYFGYKKDAMAWIKDYTTKKPMTSEQMYDFYKGR
jgi:hypothetical protein